MSAERERIKLLVAALRAPDARQAFARLGTEKGYCCLGIACEVAVANGLDLDREERPGAVPGTYEVHYNGNWLTLPERVMEWYGFSSTNPYLRVDHSISVTGRASASSVNDSFRLSFEEIADLFEYTYLEVERGQ